MVKITKAVAIDCEMVGGGPYGNINLLARVSIVNEYEECILDTFVRPEGKVTDYRTWVSGIEPHHLIRAPYFYQVQRAVADIIRNRILVGHDIEKDLEVLGLYHPDTNIRDTKKYFETIDSHPSLKNLAYKYLVLHIQYGEHSSLIDAMATMALYKKFQDKFEPKSFLSKIWSLIKKTTMIIVVITIINSIIVANK